MSAAIESLEEIKAEVEKAVYAREAEMENNLQKAAEAKERRNKALDEAQAAYKNADIKAYHKAKDEARLSEDAANMYEGIAKEIESMPYITKTQYEDYTGRITSHLDLFVNEENITLEELISELKDMQQRISQEVAEGNTLLGFVQKRAYKDPCGIVTKNGEFMPQAYKEKRYKNIEILEALNFMLAHPYLSKIAAEG